MCNYVEGFMQVGGSLRGEGNDRCVERRSNGEGRRPGTNFYFYFLFLNFFFFFNF